MILLEFAELDVSVKQSDLRYVTPAVNTKLPQNKRFVKQVNA